MEPERKPWTDEETQQLIQMYEENECLWNANLKEHWNQDKKNRILDDIAACFECSKHEVKRKLHNLRNQLAQEIKKTKVKNSKLGTDNHFVTGWKYFPSLQFLTPTLTANTLKKKSAKNALATLEFDAETSNTMIVERVEPKTVKQENGKPWKRKTEVEYDSPLKKPAVVTKMPNDEFERFGEYVTSELNSLKSDYNKRRLKSEIRKLISQIADEDDASYWAEHSASATSPPYASLVPLTVLSTGYVIESNGHDSSTNH